MKTQCNLNNQECRVSVIAGDVTLKGTLGIPAEASGIVVFAHDSGSSRHCPQNRYVAQVLRQARFATLLLDLLTQEEEVKQPQQKTSPEEEVELFAARLLGATDWLLQNPLTEHLKLGYFGNNLGASAALIAAAERPQRLSAVVSSCGSTDLVKQATLSQIKAATLLLLPADDSRAISQHQWLMEQLKPGAQLEILSGASPSLLQPGSLEQVAQLTRQWLETYLAEHKLAVSPYP